MCDRSQFYFTSSNLWNFVHFTILQESKTFSANSFLINCPYRTHFMKDFLYWLSLMIWYIYLWFNVNNGVTYNQLLLKTDRFLHGKNWAVYWTSLCVAGNFELGKDSIEMSSFSPQVTIYLICTFFFLYLFTPHFPN